jgi:hypothetical protein
LQVEEDSEGAVLALELVVAAALVAAVAEAFPVVALAAAAALASDEGQGPQVPWAAHREVHTVLLGSTALANLDSLFGLRLFNGDLVKCVMLIPAECLPSSKKKSSSL